MTDGESRRISQGERARDRRPQPLEDTGGKAGARGSGSFRSMTSGPPAGSQQSGTSGGRPIHHQPPGLCLPGPDHRRMRDMNKPSIKIHLRLKMANTLEIAGNLRVGPDPQHRVRQQSAGCYDDTASLNRRSSAEPGHGASATDYAGAMMPRSSTYILIDTSASRRASAHRPQRRARWISLTLKRLSATNTTRAKGCTGATKWPDKAEPDDFTILTLGRQARRLWIVIPACRRGTMVRARRRRRSITTWPGDGNCK